MNTCPHIITSDDGTSYCDLAASTVAALHDEINLLREALEEIARSAAAITHASTR